jgi:soluble lytic murein transglycosylase
MGGEATRTRTTARVRGVWLLLACAAGCTLSGAERRDLPTLSQTGSSGVASASSSSAPATPPARDWRRAARAQDWERVLELVAALPPAERNTPEMRLVIGKAALESGKYADAAAALAGLEERLPLVADEIKRWYAEAAAVAGPHEEGAKLLEQSAKVLDVLRAAEAYARAGKIDRAIDTATRAIQRAERTRRKGDEERGHEIRARIAEEGQKPAVAVGDQRWLMQNAEDPERVRAAIAALDRLKGPLSLDQRIEALARSSTPLNIEATLPLFDALDAANKPQAAALALGRARALYQARDYLRARAAFERATKMLTPFVAEAHYFIARSIERSGDARGALAAYQLMVQRYPTSPWAESASLKHAELLLELGRYTDAANAFQRFNGHFAKSKSADNARLGRALALLSAGAHREARLQLAALRRDTDDRRPRSALQQLEGVAALRAGDTAAAKKLWLDLIEDEPLTWGALMAHARLKAIEHAPLPPIMTEPRTVTFSALPVELPAAARLLWSLGLDQSAEARLAEMEQEAADRYPGRESEALCEMYGMLSGGRRRHQVGSRAVSLEMLMRPPSAAERWGWSCVYPTPFAELVAREERERKLPAGLVHAIMRQESAFLTEAVSPVGARGLMQLMPATAKRASDEIDMDLDLERVTRPETNVRLGAYYIAKLLTTFKGNVVVAAAAYNAGPHAVARWLAEGSDRDLDLWVARIPYSETRGYVERVVGNLARYQWLSGGVAAVTPPPITLPDKVVLGDDAY